MLRLFFTSLTMIFLSVVSAEAAYLEGSGLNRRLQLADWAPLFVGATELDGVALVAAFERSERDVHIPERIVGNLQTLVPLVDAKNARFRLTLTVEAQPNVRVSFPLQSRLVQLNGLPKVAYFSERGELEFALLPREDGGFQVNYRRQQGGQVETGEFTLNPMVEILQK